MKHFFNLFLIFTCTYIYGNEPLQNGDVIAIQLNCYSCPMIEEASNGPFSHTGIVLLEQKGQYVYQALGKIEKISLNKFLSQSRRMGKISIFRPKEFKIKYPNTKKMKEIFKLWFSDLQFDSEYSWDDDKMYCSEFVVKYLNKFLDEKINPIPMRFDANLEFWERYYQGEIPFGEPGFSPNGFINHFLFEQLISSH